MKYKANIPKSASGKWRVERFVVTDEAAKLEAMRSLFNGGRGVPAGSYTRLMRGAEVIMSDTPDELNDIFPLLMMAKNGHILITGLGLGCATEMALAKSEVDCVTVLERSEEVLSLVAPALQERWGNRLNVIHGDAFTYKIKGRFSAAWHDIWDHICSDNLPEMTKLKRRFGRMTDWGGCWCERQCRSNRWTR